MIERDSHPEWHKSLRHIPTPIDYGPLEKYLLRRLGIEHLRPLNIDRTLHREAVSDETYVFDRATKGPGILYQENKIEEEVPPGGQYKNLEALGNQKHATSVIFHLTGESYTKDEVEAFYFDPYAVRIYNPGDIEPWKKILAERDVIYEAFVTFFKYSIFML